MHSPPPHPTHVMQPGLDLLSLPRKYYDFCTALRHGVSGPKLIKLLSIKVSGRGQWCPVTKSGQASLNQGLQDASASTKVMALSPGHLDVQQVHIQWPAEVMQSDDSLGSSCSLIHYGIKRQLGSRSDGSCYCAEGNPVVWAKAGGGGVCPSPAQPQGTRQSLVSHSSPCAPGHFV